MPDLTELQRLADRAERVEALLNAIDRFITAQIWMSKRDIAKNMKLHGQCDELLKARAEYAKREPAGSPQERREG